jgi:sulfur dioxygenase
MTSMPSAIVFRQLFEPETSTYTYLLADPESRQAVLIDPVRETIERDVQLLTELGLTLVHTLETHVHADHVTSSGMLRERLGSRSVVSAKGGAPCADVLAGDGDRIAFGDRWLEVRETPGHTDGCVSYVLDDRSMVFTGDALLIRGTGRTDFQNGDPRMQYDSIFNKLLRLPDETLLFPAHDYKGDTVSTIGEEKAFNPRLQVKSIDDYVQLMNNLNLPNPKMMDVAVPANMRVGLAQDAIARRGLAVTAAEAKGLIGRSDVAFVDLRERSEREKHGVIPGSLHAPYPDLRDNLGAGGMLHALAVTGSRRILFYCAFGERSAMAVEAAQEAGLAARHIHGGIAAWKDAGGPLDR